MRKPTVLIATDSAYIDTGFGRVAREVGTGLYETGKYNIVQFGWFHMLSEKLVPFRVIATDRTDHMTTERDKYGILSYDAVVERVKPDLVLVVGDEWMVNHYAARHRDKHKLIAYVPIDGEPLMHSWMNTFRAFDHLVLYGEYGEKVVRPLAGNDFKLTKIPHGVNTEVFRPLTPAEKVECRKMIIPANDKFIVGCVARNNVRKQIPRLMKAFRQFLNPWASCKKCGSVTNDQVDTCPCGATGDDLNRGEKKNAMLYLHCVANDPAGHQLVELIHRHGLMGHVGLPDNMQVGRGVSDDHLNQFYNAFDVFTLPTSGEGWGLPILEAMSAGCPVLVTDYSAHVEFVQGAGEFISVSEWDTAACNNMERALVDISDYVMKLDRMYYSRDEFLRKWGQYMVSHGFPAENVQLIDCGDTLRAGLGQLARERALKYQWSSVIKQWEDLIDSLLPKPADSETAVSSLPLEVI